MKSKFIIRSLAGEIRMRTLSVLALLFAAQLAMGCDVLGEPKAARMELDQVENSAEKRPLVVFELGEPMPPVPEGLKVRPDLNDITGGTVAIEGSSQIRVTTYEGRHFNSPAEHVEVFLSKQGRVEDVVMWALPRPMPWLDAVARFKNWLKMNRIKPNEILRKELEIWSNNDIPGYEMPRNIPQRYRSGMDLTPTSGLFVLWKPHPVRDWILVLSVSLTAKEMNKIREREEAANEDQNKQDESKENEPAGPLDKFRKWDETHGDIDIQKLLNDEYEARPN